MTKLLFANAYLFYVWIYLSTNNLVFWKVWSSRIVWSSKLKLFYNFRRLAVRDRNRQGHDGFRDSGRRLPGQDFAARRIEGDPDRQASLHHRQQQGGCGEVRKLQTRCRWSTSRRNSKATSEPKTTCTFSSSCLILTFSFAVNI